MSEIGNVSGMVAVAIGLLVFGLLYNWLVSWIESNGYDEGYTSILVVIGSGVTLAFVALVDWRAALLASGAFACSGLPMVIGGWWRHVQVRRRSQELLRASDDATAHLAE